MEVIARRTHATPRFAAWAAAAIATLSFNAYAEQDGPLIKRNGRVGTVAELVPGKAPIDRSGQRQVGKASYYGDGADGFAGRKMANGEPMRPGTNNAASRTLPLGTTARVTNLENGKSAIVVIKDRGPYVAGRIVDVSPSTAQKLDFVDDGVAPVEVVPLSVPQPREASGAKARVASAEVAELAPR